MVISLPLWELIETSTDRSVIYSLTEGCDFSLYPQTQQPGCYFLINWQTTISCIEKAAPKTDFNCVVLFHS